MSKRVVITGGSSGIGKSLSRLLAAKGWTVFCLSRTAPEVEGVKHLSVDLRDLEQVREALEQVGTFEALVNNAGVAYMSSIIDGDPKEWSEMWAVNVQALAYCAKISLPMFPENDGQIVNVSSMSGHRVPPSGGFYSPTKFAVKALTEALRLELRSRGSKVRVSSISPGFVDTPLLETYFRGREEQLEATKKEMNMLTDEDVALQIYRILETPSHIEVGDVSLRSVEQRV